MKKAELKNFGKPDEVREFPKGRVELIKQVAQPLDALFSSRVAVGHLSSAAGEDQSCEAPHFRYIVVRSRKRSRGH